MDLGNIHTVNSLKDIRKRSETDTDNKQISAKA